MAKAKWTTVEYEAPAQRPPLVGDELAYVVPMAVFLGFNFLASQWPSQYALFYAVKTFVVAAMLVLFWRQFTRIRWNAWWLGLIVGVVGIAQWVPMQLWLQDVTQGMWIGRFFKPPDDPFNPFATFDGNPSMLWSFVAVRIAGAVLVVPVMEELFWRDWLWRTILAPNDFKLAKVGEWDWKAFAVVSLLFATVHGNWWLTAIIWAAMVGALLVYTKSLGACILAHATTNLLLAGYVLYTKNWAFW